MTQNGLKMTQYGSKWPKNDISEMLRFTRFARHKFSAARHLKLFCTPGNWDSLSVARFMFVADMHGGTW